MEDKFKVGDIAVEIDDDGNAKDKPYLITETPNTINDGYKYSTLDGDIFTESKDDIETYMCKAGQVASILNNTLVRFKNGNFGIVLDGMIYGKEFNCIASVSEIMFNIFTANSTIFYKHHKNKLTIMELYKPINVHDFLNMREPTESIWKRPTKKVTMKEVCDKFGYEVEIVEE